MSMFSELTLARELAVSRAGVLSSAIELDTMSIGYYSLKARWRVCKPLGLRVFNNKALAQVLLLGAIAGPNALVAASSDTEEQVDPSIPARYETPVIVVTDDEPSKAKALRESAEAVNVLETEAVQAQSADLGEVLAREQGVSVQRSGGLGSSVRFSLNGLTNDQIRIFLDGIPLDFAGYPFGFASLPLSLIDRVEIFSGVVPVRFGADALGGAVNLVTDDSVGGTHGSISYQAGSFGTYRTFLEAEHLDAAKGSYLRARAFFDHSDNDYLIDVEAPNSSGQITEAKVHRFHDAYTAWGASLEAGFVTLPWAGRLSLQTYVTGYWDEIQHNVNMTVPYGDAEMGEVVLGGVFRYDHRFVGGLNVESQTGYSYGALEFIDLGECIYSWYGQCVGDRAQPGEVTGNPRDVSVWEQNVFSRSYFKKPLSPHNSLNISLAPTLTSRTGVDRSHINVDVPDPLSAQQDLASLVTGVEFSGELIGGRLAHIAFGKSYLQILRSEEVLSSGVVRELDRDTARFGGGFSLRYWVSDQVYGKLSYERATRLPRTDEIFGNGGFIVANLELEPEVSDNLNLGLNIDASNTKTGSWRAELGTFYRDADQLIQLFGSSQLQSYQNVYSARSLGTEAGVAWQSLSEQLDISGNFTYVDFRNTSSEGVFGNYAGDRIPNRPYLFANASVSVTKPTFALPGDELSLFWDTRYVHPFFLSWESVGDSAYKLKVQAQLLHSIALVYRTSGQGRSLSFATEIQNLTDQLASDFYGIQRPGRAIYFKVSASF